MADRYRLTAAQKRQLEELEDKYLDCRWLRHPWRREGAYKDGKGNIRLRLVCIRCDTVRTVVWKSNGERVASGGGYKYADGYQIVGGSPGQQFVRREVMRRLKIYDNYDMMMANVIPNGKGRNGRN